MNFLLLHRTDAFDRHVAALLVCVSKENGDMLISKARKIMGQRPYELGTQRLYDIEDEYGVQLLDFEGHKIKRVVEFNITYGGGKWRVKW